MLSMDNETIILNNPSLTDEQFEELFAMKALAINPNAIITNVMAFEKFCFAVNGIIPNPEAVDIPNVLMIAGAIQKIESFLNKKLTFSEPSEHTVACYIAHVAFDEGWVILPNILSFAQNELNKLTSDNAKRIFALETKESLLKKVPWDDDNPISNHCARSQALQEYLLITKQ